MKYLKPNVHFAGGSAHQAPAPQGSSARPETELSNRGNMKSFWNGNNHSIYQKAATGGQNHMAKNEETSTRGSGKGQKLLSGTEDQLIEDLQRVHKLFPNAEPDRDFYRAHGMYTDAAWKEHFSRFEVFVAEAGLLPRFRQTCYWLARTVEVLQQHGKDLSAEEAAIIREMVNDAYSLLMTARGFSEQEKETMREKLDNLGSMLAAEIESEEFTSESAKGLGNEQAT
jgi:hypothetical protein